MCEEHSVLWMSDHPDTDEGTLHHVSPYSGPLKRLFDYMTSTIPQDGDFKWSARTDDHYGWIRCNGRSLSQEEAPKLFKVIGFTYGRSGIRFRIPDPRGRVLGAVNDAYPQGSTVGEETIVLSENELPSHYHTGYTSTEGSHTHTYQDALFAEGSDGTFATSSSTSNGDTLMYRTASGGVSASE